MKILNDYLWFFNSLCITVSLFFCATQSPRCVRAQTLSCKPLSCQLLAIPDQNHDQIATFLLDGSIFKVYLKTSDFWHNDGFFWGSIFHRWRKQRFWGWGLYGYPLKLEELFNHLSFHSGDKIFRWSHGGGSEPLESRSSGGILKKKNKSCYPQCWIFWWQMRDLVWPVSHVSDQN